MISTTSVNWSLRHKLGFRFSFLYFGLFIILQNNGAYPFISSLLKKPLEWMDSFYVWLGKNILGLDYEFSAQITGSGDMTKDYICLLLIFVIALIGALIWSIIDKNRKNYSVLYYWLIVAIRLYVGLMLINYGFYKLFKTQFPYPSIGRLSQPYGNSSPMGLAWTFLGFSYGYNIFMGIAEVAAGLLLFRKTITLGALITFVTGLNIMAINYFYDIPVKILSTHLVLMTLFLLLPNVKSLFAIFVRGRTIDLKSFKRPLYKKKNTNKILSLIKLLFIGYFIIDLLISNFKYLDSKKIQIEQDFDGKFEIEFFSLNKEERTHFKDSIRWKSISVNNRRSYISIEKMNKKRSYYKYEVDTLKKLVHLKDYYDSTRVYRLNYKKTDSLFNFNIIMEKDTIKANAIKKDFQLMSRGFNWISERPFNR